MMDSAEKRRRAFSKLKALSAFERPGIESNQALFVKALMSEGIPSAKQHMSNSELTQYMASEDGKGRRKAFFGKAIGRIFQGIGKHGKSSKTNSKTPSRNASNRVAFQEEEDIPQMPVVHERANTKVQVVRAGTSKSIDFRECLSDIHFGGKITIQDPIDPFFERMSPITYREGE